MTTWIAPIKHVGPSTLQSYRSILSPSGKPLAVGVVVRTSDVIQEDVLSLSLEVPLDGGFQRAGDKAVWEAGSVADFLADLAASPLDVSWNLLGPGPDPPDFLVGRGDAALGLDLTRLTSSRRQLGHAQFRAVQRAILDAGDKGFEHLRDQLVFFWAVGDDRDGGIIKREEVATVVEALRRYRPKLVPLGRERPVFDFVAEFGRGNAHWKFMATPWVGPTSRVRDAVGFDVGLCLQTSHTVRDAVSELRRVITKHDKRGCEIVVVQIGVPDRKGWTFPSDELIADFIMEAGRKWSFRTESVQRVFLHFWRTGRIVEITRNVTNAIGSRRYR